MKTLDQVEDYKEAASILNEEYVALNWHGTTIHGGSLFTDDSGWKHYAYQVEFAPPSKPRVSFDWKCGTGHAKVICGHTVPIKPNPAEVLGRCCAEYLSASESSFEDWAENFGYDSDSRKALSIYDECMSIGKKLQKLGLSREQIKRFAGLADML